MNFQTKVLIGDDTIEYGICCANALRKAKMYAITRHKDGKDIFEAITVEHPDVVVIDATMPNLDAIDLIKRTRIISEHTPKFIVTSPYDNPFLESQIMKSGADYFMLKPFDINTLVSRINALTAEDTENNSSENLDIIVTDIIHMFGIPAHIKGYRYLREAIMLCLGKRSMLDSITKTLYPAVALKFNASTAGVERAIRHAIDIIWTNENRTLLINHFGSKKPTNSEFIAYITDKITISYGFKKLGA